MPIIKEFVEKRFKSKNFFDLIAGSGFSLVAVGVSTIAAFFSSYILEKHFDSGALGLLALINSFWVFGGLFGMLGLNVAISRIIPEQLAKNSYKSAKAAFNKCLRILILATVLTSAASIILSTRIAEDFYKQENFSYIIKISAIFLILRTTQPFFLMGVAALKRKKEYGVLNSIQPIIFLVTCIISFISGFTNELSLLTCYILSAGISSLLSVWRFITNFSTIGINSSEKSSDSINYNSILKICIPLAFSSAMQIILTQTDIVMLSRYVPKEIGVYYIIVKLGTVGIFVANIVTSLSSAKYSELFYSENKKELKNFVYDNGKLILSLTMPIVILLILFGNPILGIYGENYKNGFQALIIITIAQTITSVFGPLGHLLNMTGNQFLMSYSMAAIATTNIVLNYYLINILGLNGAALATLFCSLLWSCLLWFYVRLKLKL